MTARPPPTFLFVPGAWHLPLAYQPLIDLLSTAGHSSRTVTLASVGADPPLESFAPDVAAIRTALASLLDAGTDVVLVMHSYGGVVGSEAVKDFMPEGGQAAGAGAEGSKGHIVSLAWLCGFILPAGASLMAGVGFKDLPWWDVKDKILNPIDPAYRFYNDLPAPAAQHWASLLKPHSYRTLHSPVTVEPWAVFPSAYLVCENDNAVSVEAQDGMIAAARAKAPQAFGLVERCGAGHSPFLSMPEVVLGFLERAAGG